MYPIILAQFGLAFVFMFICDILLLSYLAFIIYRKIKKLFDRSYFYIDTSNDEKYTMNQVTKFTYILKHNVQKNIIMLSHTKGMNTLFDFSYVMDTIDQYIDDDITNKIMVDAIITKSNYLEININEYIIDVSNLICDILNRMAFENNCCIRFTYSHDKECGYFNILTISRNGQINHNQYVYDIYDHSNGKTYHIIKYDEEFHNYLSKVVLNLFIDVKVVKTSLIDGVIQWCVIIPFNKDMRYYHSEIFLMEYTGYY